VTDTAEATPRNRRSTIAIALASASLALAVLSCLATGLVASLSNVEFGLPVQSKPTAADADQVEAVAHVVLPPGTVLLTAVYSNGLETHLAAKVRIPREAVDSFVAAGRFTAPPPPGLRAITAKHNLGGGNLWHPETAVTVSGIEENQPGPENTYRSVLFDLDVPETALVYLYASRG
jgi:hypothetical protein